MAQLTDNERRQLARDIEFEQSIEKLRFGRAASAVYEDTTRQAQESTVAYIIGQEEQRQAMLPRSKPVIELHQDSDRPYRMNGGFFNGNR
ncbi:MAG: hypothetical protein Q7R76_03535 [Candidatus Woesearchaeota archaeon]|nr:hypothetical protein [Candidatus Woesearchaeota archaeon]